MSPRPEIPFEDMLDSLWSQAYKEIIAIIQDSRKDATELLWEEPYCNIMGLFVSSDGFLNFIDVQQHYFLAEELPDDILYESYRRVYKALCRKKE